jgi:signal transduction histidine kinase
MRLERERISRDLHDNIGAYANAVLYNTELLQQQDDTEKKNDIISDLHFASKDIITSLRETVWALKKDNYSAADCLIRIRNFIQPFTRYYHHIIFKVEGEAPPNLILQHDKALHLVRIVQEAVSNAIKHAGAKNISILSEVGNECWKLSVTDDGKGFDVEEKKQLQSGNGLGNMEERAASAGVVFSIESKENQGTVVTIICG